ALNRYLAGSDRPIIFRSRDRLCRSAWVQVCVCADTVWPHELLLSPAAGPAVTAKQACGTGEVTPASML
ncbi:MAG TPA: hypothetical protein VN345_15800, partial [Blastocatellia bacterium]|nr:hypothetical protein [Blastocatellia bacterium]